MQRGIKDVVTLFHNPSSQASIRAHTILKQAAGNASANATIDQAGDHAQQSKQGRTEFELGKRTRHSSRARRVWLAGS